MLISQDKSSLSRNNFGGNKRAITPPPKKNKHYRLYRERNVQKGDLSVIPKNCLEKLFSHYAFFILIASSIYHISTSFRNATCSFLKYMFLAILNLALNLGVIQTHLDSSEPFLSSSTLVVHVAAPNQKLTSNHHLLVQL